MTFYAGKDPDARLDFGVDWGEWLTTGDAIQSVAWAMTGPDAALTLSDDVVTGTRGIVWVAGGTVGFEYRLTCTVTTDAGAIDQRSIVLTIRDY